MNFQKLITTLLFLGVVLFVSACGKHTLPGIGDADDNTPVAAAADVDADGLPTQFIVINSYQGAGIELAPA